MTKREFIELIEDVDDDTELVFPFENRLISICPTDSNLAVIKDEDGEIVEEIFVLAPCFCGEEECDCDFDVEDEVEVDGINLN